MVREGICEEEARKRVWLVDSKGLIVKDRPKGGINHHKSKFAHAHEPVDTLTEAVLMLKPTVLIGAVSGHFKLSLSDILFKLNYLFAGRNRWSLYTRYY